MGHWVVCIFCYSGMDLKCLVFSKGNASLLLRNPRRKPFQSLGQFRMLAPAMQNPKGVTVSEKRFRATGRSFPEPGRAARAVPGPCCGDVDGPRVGESDNARRPVTSLREESKKQKKRTNKTQTDPQIRSASGWRPGARGAGWERRRGGGARRGSHSEGGDGAGNRARRTVRTRNGAPK